MERRNTNFVRNGEGSSSVRLRRRKDAKSAQIPSCSADLTSQKKRNRHSGDFYQWNPASHHHVNRFSMFENRLLIDENRMETLDRRIPENDTNASSADMWKLPVLTRPPISGTGNRILDEILYNHNRRSCDFSNTKIHDKDDDDVKTDVNRNIANDKTKVNSKLAAKKYHKRVSVEIATTICNLFCSSLPKLKDDKNAELPRQPENGRKVRTKQKGHC